jgi:succinyl-CoA synthetase alpha subunit
MIQKQKYVNDSEIGGQLEADAAHWIKADGNRKPVVDVQSTQQVTMGHAGAIVGGTDDAGRRNKS